MTELALERSETTRGQGGPEAARGPRGSRRESGHRSRADSPTAVWHEAIVLTPLALLLPRAVLPGGVAPAGLALVMAFALTGVDNVLWYATAALLSLFLMHASLALLGKVPAYLLAACLGRRWSAGTRAYRLIVPVMALSALGQALAGRWGADSVSPWTGILLEAVLAGLLTPIFARAMPILRHGPLAAGGREDSLFLALVPLALAVHGLTQMNILGLRVAYVSATFVVALLGYLGGPGLGAGMGVLLGVAPGLGYGPRPVVGGLALGGLMTGLLRQSGRLAVFLGYGLGFGLPFIWYTGDGNTLWAVAGESLLGLCMFLALPQQPLHKLGLTLPAGQAWGAAKRAEQARLRDLLSDRVQELAGVFAQMSKAFVAQDAEDARPNLYSLLEETVHRGCDQCTAFDSCWRQNFYASYRELFDLLAMAEMHGSARGEHLGGRLGTACLQQRKLLETVDDLLGRVQSGLATRQEALNGKGFVADQLEGVAGIMTRLATEMRLDVDFRVEMEDRLKASFNRLGLAVDSLSVLEYCQDMLEVRVHKHGCLNQLECQYLVAPMVSRLLGHTFTIWEKQCPNSTHTACSFTLVPAGRFQVKHAVGRLAKEEGCCGDDHALVQSKDGRYILILSDGMGTGRKAAHESRATVNLLAQLLSSGLNEEFALNMINSVLMLRTPEERFATIDIAMIDLFRGQVELIKVGAAPSYIKRGRQVIPVRASTPPAGILHKVEVDRQSQQLMAGDYLILASDGIFAGGLDPEEAEDWVGRALSRVEVAGPQPMVDFLLKIAQTNMGREMKDDVTIIVAQLTPAGIE